MDFWQIFQEEADRNVYIEKNWYSYTTHNDKKMEGERMNNERAQINSKKDENEIMKILEV